MKNEAEFKSIFKKSIKAQGGFSLSIAAPMLAGLPDLYVIMPGYTPLLLEAKWLGKVRAGFNRKIGYSKLQQHYLTEICKIKDYTALGLIGWEQLDCENGKYWCTLIHPSFEQIDYYWVNCTHIPLKNKLFDVATLLSYYPIPRINGVCAKNAD